MKNFILIILLLIVASTLVFAQKKRKKNKKVEKVEAHCTGIAISKRPLITVSRFEVVTSRARREFGGEMSAMLSNALVETGCFNVLGSGKDIADITDELKINQQLGGGTGELKGVKSAQYLITGKITEFEENHIGTRLAGIGIGAYKAHIGFIIQIKNRQREIIFSKSIDMKRTKPGSAGASIFGLPLATSNFSSKAMADALEDGIIQAVEILVEQKDQIEIKASNQTATAISYNRSNCPILQSGTPPKVMVLIPETHLRRRIPDPASETEIIKKLTNAGFPVVDPTMYQAIRTNGNITNIVSNPVEAANIGAKYGANLIIIGEAFSESNSNVNGMKSCRARVEARIIQTKDAIIIGADGKHGSGLDISEAVAAKTALRNAGSAMGDFFLERLCSSGGTTTPISTNGNSTSASRELIIVNANYSLFSQLSQSIKSYANVSNVSKTFSNGEGRIQFSYSKTMDDLIDRLLSSQPTLEVLEFGNNNVKLNAK